MKISDSLLSSVLGCECELYDFNRGSIAFRTNKYIYMDCVFYNRDFGAYFISIDTFIRLAKIWAAKNGYEIITESNSVEVYDWEESNGAIFSAVIKDEKEFYEVGRELEVLEWVCSEVNDER